MARKTQTPPKSFEEALQELEQILGEIENGELGLEESLVKYERGNFLIQHCRGVLSGAEKQIELLSQAADGSLQRKPFEIDDGGGNSASSPEPSASQGGNDSESVDGDQD